MYVQFTYGVNNPVNNIHERALRIVFGDYRLTFQQLLKQNKSVSTHQRNLQILATEIFKTKKWFKPSNPEGCFQIQKLNE